MCVSYEERIKRNTHINTVEFFYESLFRVKTQTKTKRILRPVSVNDLCLIEKQSSLKGRRLRTPIFKKFIFH